MKKIQLPNGMSIADLNLLKKKHGKLIIVTVEATESVDYEEKDGELFIKPQVKNLKKRNVSAIFKQADKELIAEVTRRSQKDEMAGAKLFYNGCKLSIDKEIDEEASLYIAVLKSLIDKFNEKKGNSLIL